MTSSAITAAQVAEWIALDKKIQDTRDTLMELQKEQDAIEASLPKNMVVKLSTGGTLRWREISRYADITQKYLKVVLGRFANGTEIFDVIVKNRPPLKQWILKKFAS
jgi:hypothetical protein